VEHEAYKEVRERLASPWSADNGGRTSIAGSISRRCADRRGPNSGLISKPGQAWQNLGEGLFIHDLSSVVTAGDAAEGGAEGLRVDGGGIILDRTALRSRAGATQ
jgi:hypothetical protein